VASKMFPITPGLSDRSSAETRHGACRGRSKHWLGHERLKHDQCIDVPELPVAECPWEAPYN
jgi:hypothetical protein